MKLFVYCNINFMPFDIHAIGDLINGNRVLCSEGYTYIEKYDKCDYLDTTRPFCKECERLLKKDYKINMKQLAINQKLGIK